MFVHNKVLSPLQIALQSLQDTFKKFGYAISKKKVKNRMIEAILKRFPNGTDLCNGKLSSSKAIKHASVQLIKDAVQEWANLEGDENIKSYVDQIIHHNSDNSSDQQLNTDDGQVFYQTDHMINDLNTQNDKFSCIGNDWSFWDFSDDG
jgi:hypothetical protein